MPRSIWKGSIAFGLVHIPVDLHVAEEPDDLTFRQLDKRDFSPIGYERINKATGKKVAWEDIVKGYEVAKDEYVVLSEAELESANVEATHTIDLVAFVDAKEIPPMYFDKPYYLTPTKQGAKAYALLRETLSRTGQVGVAQIVICTRQHLAALVPRDDVLMLVTMRYQHELRTPDDLDLPHGSLQKLGVAPKELDMAERLVRGMHAEFDPSEYKDRFRDDVMALIEKKADAGDVNTVPHEARARGPERPTNVVDLMSLLKKSLGEKGLEKGAAKEEKKPRGPGPRKTTHRSHTGKRSA
jgi:DNA end-binding protein Ku